MLYCSPAITRSVGRWSGVGLQQRRSGGLLDRAGEANRTTIESQHICVRDPERGFDLNESDRLHVSVWGYRYT
jgi:hypothetical protein